MRLPERLPQGKFAGLIGGLFPPNRVTYLQASRGSKKALHLVMRSRRPSCESLDTHRESETQHAGRGEEMSQMAVAGSLVVAVWMFMTAGITVVMFMAGRKAVRK